jgi:hypothetical protein
MMKIKATISNDEIQTINRTFQINVSTKQNNYWFSDHKGWERVTEIAYTLSAAG